MEKKCNWLIPVAGFITGVAALLLTAFGNPENMGFCIACFLRDTAGAMKLHSASAVQYVRPELIGLVLGAFLLSLAAGEFKPRAGSSPATRFLIGAFVMIGALAFLGCPLRMVLRMAGGDANAWVGFLGFVLGILIGIFFLNRGFSLKRSYPAPKFEGALFPALTVGLLIAFLAVPALFVFSESGPGSKHAPVLLSLLLSLLVGAAAQKSRLCMVGGIRDAFLFRDFHLLSGFGVLFATVLLGNLLLGNFTGFSFTLQPVSHSDWLWNVLGMLLVGWGSVLLGGCPLRQLILAGAGNSDSAVTVLGMLAGAAFSHNWGLAGSAASSKDGVYSAGGVGTNGRIAVCAGLAVLAVLSLCNIERRKKQAAAAKGGSSV